MTARKPPSNVTPIAQALAAAEPQGADDAGAFAADDDGDAEAMSGADARDDWERRERTRHVIEPPDDMPIVCLGLNGDLHYYLDGHYQFRAMKAGDHGRLHLLALFGRHQAWLLDRFGTVDKNKLPTGKFKAEVVQNMLFHGCNKAGLLDPLRQVRGVGAWADAEGHLIVHMGDRVFLNGETKPPGRYGEHIYPAFPPTPRPARIPEGTDAGHEAIAILQTWHWENALQPLLVLGWIAQGYVAGAVKWRTHMICDGERGSGKSTLQALLARLFGSWLLSTSDTTAAALYQLMGGRAQPVAIDEFEFGDNPARKQQVIQVLRQASSGGMVQRGGDNHVGRQFSAQFPAFLTAITPISLHPQDESRMVRVKLRALDDNAAVPDLSEARLAALGARLMRRMRDQWPRWVKTLDAWRAGLAEFAGLDARMQDLYGTLLAAADLLLYEDVAGSGAQLWAGDGGAAIEDTCRKLAAMIAPARAEDLADQARCLNHLLTSNLDRGGGAPRRTVASWIRQVRDGQTQNRAMLDGAKTLESDAQKALGMTGLRVISEKDGTFLFVANSHPALMRLFDGTPWPGVAGAAGSWVGTLRRLPGATPTPNAIKVGGATQRGTLVPIDDVIAWEGEE